MKGTRVLLVEDDLGLATALKDFFEDNGFYVIHTDDGGKAIGLFQKELPDIVVLDIILPNKTGFDIIEEIREVNIDVPVLLMTGTEVEDEKQIKGYELGAINYMKKPVIPQILLAQIRNLLSIPKDPNFFKLD